MEEVVNAPDDWANRALEYIRVQFPGIPHATTVQSFADFVHDSRFPGESPPRAPWGHLFVTLICTDNGHTWRTIVMVPYSLSHGGWFTEKNAPGRDKSKTILAREEQTFRERMLNVAIKRDPKYAQYGVISCTRMTVIDGVEANAPDGSVFLRLRAPDGSSALLTITLD